MSYYKPATDYTEVAIVVAMLLFVFVMFAGVVAHENEKTENREKFRDRCLDLGKDWVDGNCLSPVDTGRG